MALSAPGLGSNLDVTSLVSQLMAAEQKPLEKLNLREASFQSRLSAFSAIKGSMGNLRSTMTSLRDMSRFTGFRPAVADSSIASVSVSGTPATGSYSLEVTDLAQAHKLKSGTTFATPTDTVGSGTITLQFGRYDAGVFELNADRPTQTITIDPAATTLAAVRDSINSANAGVNANLVNDGGGQRLVLSSTFSGADNALRIMVDDDDGTDGDAAGLSRLAYDASTGGISNMIQTVVAKDAAFILDGIEISTSSNTVTNVLEGVTLQLAKTNVDNPTTLTIAKDNGAITSAVDAFAKAWNDTAKMLRDVSAYNAATKQGAVLQGDATVLALQSQLRGLLGNPLAGELTALSDAGVSFDTNGNLTVDSGKLGAAIAAGKDVASLFAVGGKPTNSLVRYVAATDSASAGRLGIDITQAATRGTATGSIATALTITTSVNDTLSVTVDGTAVGISLAAGTYTPVTLAAELRSRINGALGDANSSATVDVTASGGVLTITSPRYGAGSTVELTGGTALSDLFGTPVSAAGLDVAGSIGGVVGTGNGQRLTAAGISLDILGNTTGDHGTLNFSRGYADQLHTLVDRMLASEGAIAARTDGINASIKDIGSQRERMNDRLAAVEKRYRAQFIALDTMISRMTQTSTFLQNQLSSLPKVGS